MQPIEFFSAAADVVRVNGKDRLDLLHRLSTRDLRPLKEAQRAASTLFTTHQGKLIDWVWVLGREDHLLLHASAGRAETLAAWIAKYTIMEDVTCAVLPNYVALTVWAEAAALNLDSGAAADAVQTRGEGIWRRGLAAMGSPWMGLLPTHAALVLTAHLESLGAKRLDASAMEARRIDAGVPSPTYEYKDEVNPLELRLVNAAVSWNKGCYIGQEVISRLDSYDKVARYTMGFETVEAASDFADIEGEAKLTRDGKPLGRVTSRIEHAGKMHGLAVVKREAAISGPAQIEISGRSYAVLLRDCPFWQPAA